MFIKVRCDFHLLKYFPNFARRVNFWDFFFQDFISTTFITSFKINLNKFDYTIDLLS